MNKQDNKSKLKHREEYGGNWRKRRVGEVKGVKDIVTKRDLTLCCVHTMHYTGDYYRTIFFKAI